MTKDYIFKKEETEEDAKSLGVGDNKKRIYECTFEGCTKSYTKNSHLKTHLRSHTGGVIRE